MSDRVHSPTVRLAWAALGVGLGVGLALLAGLRRAEAQVKPAQTVAQLRPAAGLEAKLWASEPMVENPTNMDVDSRGRVWVTEGLNYRLTRARNQRLGKVDEADRIKILEDTDGDGKADKVTVFADRIFPVPMGIAVEEHYGRDGKYRGCRVFVGNSPDLLVLEDTDGDDKADRRYPLLTGFGGVDSDHGVHGMVLALDGKLYFTHGDGCCSVQHDHSERPQNFDVVDKSGRHVWSDQLANTLRVNRDGTEFEILADRQRNNYETSLNAFGNVFTSDNDDDGNRGCRVICVLDGGHYGYRTAGSPRHWGEDVPGNIPKLVGTGNGSPCGITVYEGDLFGKDYFGAILEADAGTRQINLFPLTRHGAMFRTDYKVFLGCDDNWFRPVDMTAAPDGSVFVADWYDAGVGGHAFRDQNTGRIYRVTPAGVNPKPVKHNFATVHGLIEALKSPVVAAQDAARRSLIERAGAVGDSGEAKPRPARQEVLDSLVNLFSSGRPHERARALWVLYAIVGDRAAEDALKDRDPRIREQAVRILGRDDRENGHVEYKDPKARKAPRAQAHLKTLLPLAADPDAGVRRELILAVRNLPTEQVGEALKTLARMWDGRDRWYLEALGLALEKRASDYVASLFDGTLYGDLDLDNAGQAAGVALPPYFPVDRNEAYIATDANELPVSALSKSLGLAWRLHRPEVLGLVGRVSGKLDSAELQQASDDVIAQVQDPAGADALAGLIAAGDDPARQSQVLELLARKLGGAWEAARGNPKVVQTIQSALEKPETQAAGLAAAAASGDKRFGDEVAALVRNPRSTEEVRAAAVEALGRLKPPGAQAVLDGLIAETQGKGHSNSLAEAAVRALPSLGDPRERLSALIVAKDYPLGLRREALRTFARYNDGGQRVLAMAREGKLPDDLKTEATTVLHSHPDRNLRGQAARVLPLPKNKSGRPLPPIGMLLRREGRADQGRGVFFRLGTGQQTQAGQLTCGGCHRVQGRGEWVGPDLSTIGTKYGRDELLRSILNPSAAIGYNYRTQVVATKDGQVLTGLAVEETPDRLVLKTADGKRVTVRPGDVDERSTSDVSLMPEGLAETMTEDELVDLLAFLSTLRQPVSIVGQYQAVGPVAEAKGTPAFDTSEKVNLAAGLTGDDGRKLAWRRLDTSAEGRADLAPLLAGSPGRAAYLYVPIGSPVEQDAELVLDTPAEIKVWLGGKPLELPAPRGGEPRAVPIDLPRGTTDLLIRVTGGPAPIVTTLVSDRPVDFSSGEGKTPTR